MGKSKKRVLVGTDGYFTQESPLTTPPGALLPPSQNFIYRENGVLESFGGYGFAGVFGNDRAFALENGWATMAGGNVMEYSNRSLIFVGGGNLVVNMPVVNGSLLTIGAASSIPQIAVLNGAANGYLAPRQMGLSPQGTAPLLTEPSVLGTGFIGKITGVISAVLARRRGETGALSIASPVSNVIGVTGKSIHVLIPSAPSDGTSHWRIYLTEHGGGTINNHLQFPIEIAEADLAAGTVNGSYGNALVKSVPAMSRVVEIEYEDNDLLPVAPPTDLFPAESCDFVEKLGNVVILFGTHKGLGIWPSIANNPEGFRPDHVQFIAEPIIAVLKPHDGMIWVLCRNSIYVVLLSGAVEGSAIVVRPVYEKKGVKVATAAVAIGDELYFMSAGGMPCRITPDGNYDDKFSLAVRGFFDAWNMTKVVCSYDEKANVILFCHGTSAMCYHIDYGFWSPPIYSHLFSGAMPGAGAEIRAAFVQEGLSHLVYWSAINSRYEFWTFDNASTGSQWILRTSETPLDMPLDYKTIVGGKVHYYNAGAGNILAALTIPRYGSTRPYPESVFNLTLINAGQTVTNWIPMNCNDLVEFWFKIAGSGTPIRINGFEFDVISTGGIR